MGLNPTYAPGATPLDPDEAAALIPRHITTQGELNEWELQNIIEGAQWAAGRRTADILSFEFMLDLHRQMLGKTWRWAGTFRNSQKNIGVGAGSDCHLCKPAQSVRTTSVTSSNTHAYPVREIGARLSSTGWCGIRSLRMNGNGRLEFA